MKEICPACGAPMNISIGTFSFNRNGQEIVLENVEQLECTKCHEVTFTAEQSEALHRAKMKKLQESGTAA